MDTAEQRIREIAHRLWETSGRPSGLAQRHWEDARQIFEAERTAFVKHEPISTVSSSSQHRVDTNMRNFDELVAEAQKTLAIALREAFDAGRAHTASELKHRMAALFEDLVSGSVAHSERTTPTPGHEGPHSDQGQS